MAEMTMSYIRTVTTNADFLVNRQTGSGLIFQNELSEVTDVSSVVRTPLNLRPRPH